MTEIEGNKPYENTGIKEGDIIIGVDDLTITTTNELLECVKASKGKILEIKFISNGEEKHTKIEPVKTYSNDFKLGLWVRDGAAGIGTITYYEPKTEKCAALGHGIIDSDTQKLISVENGDIVTSNIIEIKKGEEGVPGQIKGTIANGEKIGEVFSNTEFGIYGKITDKTKFNIDNSNIMPVANRNEISIGKAKMLLTIENGIRKEYEIEISKIYKNNNIDNKSMLIKVTDSKLLNLTGGIIQGMSGAPIIQNGNFIGAVTHVFVNKPTEGYAVFGDLMLKTQEK